MAPTFSESQKALLKKICFYIWLFFIPIGVYATVNTSFLSAMMDQPSNYTASITCLSIVYMYCSDFSVKDKLTSVFMLAIGLIVVQSQFYIFFLVTCGLLMYFHHADVLKNNLRTGIALTSIAALIIYISRYEILNYLFPAGVTGSGFASLAIQASGFYSQINELGFQPMNGFMSQEWFSVSGSYYPVLAQLGVIGILFHIAFWVYIIVTSIIQFRQKGDIQPFIIVLILATFIFIENITDSFFTSNKGYFMMMFIGILLSNPESAENVVPDTSTTTKKKKKFSLSQIIRLTEKKLLLFVKKGPPTYGHSYLMPPIPVAKRKPVIERRKATVVTHQLTPVIDISQSIELPEKEENKEENTPTVIPLNETVANEQPTVNVPLHETVANEPPTAKAPQPPDPFVEEEEEDDFDLGDDFDDEYEWDDDFIEEEEDEEINMIEEEIELVSPVQIEEENKPAPPVREMEEESRIEFSNAIQDYKTNTNELIMTSVFNPSGEALPKKVNDNAGDYEDDDIFEAPLNYII